MRTVPVERMSGPMQSSPLARSMPSSFPEALSDFQMQPFQAEFTGWGQASFMI